MRRQFIQRAAEPPLFGSAKRPYTSLFNRGLMLLTLILTVISTAGAEDAASMVLPPAASEQRLQKSEVFLTAQAAYDAGRYDEAAALYEQLVDLGVDNIELHYNLANAQFKSGRLPEAVMHYRKAWYKAPGDPDIRANLHFALNAAGAAESSPSIIERTFTTLSESRWIMAATLGYLTLIGLLILSILIPHARRTLIRLSLLVTIFILLSSGGWWYWQQLTTHPEWVVIRSDATALFAPIEGTTAHYKVPLAALVRQCGIDSKGWIEIEYDGKKGWLRELYIKRVYP